ncbi:hypothetical protein [Streptomyces sp. NBC_00358]|jgi:hypothetical protein|uniref:hypothetical protein n=1 Tax=Streptomyces sp. NBC_00358 TaxID=2975725 RepID=UPI002E269CA0
MTSASTEVETAPVFVDQSGQRGRRLRGLGWLLGIICTGFVVAMVSGLVGTQSQAPGLTVPGTANTTPPSQYLNAPLPAAPGVAEPGSTTTAPATTSDVIASVTAAPTAGTAGTAGTAATNSVSGVTASVTATPAAGTAATSSVSGATASVTATPAAGTAATSSVSGATAQ